MISFTVLYTPYQQGCTKVYRNEKYRENVYVAKDLCCLTPFGKVQQVLTGLGSSIIFQENRPLNNPVNKAVNVKASSSLSEEDHLVSVLYQDVAPVV